MPFTPFHMGPGLALKALGGPRFSLVAFGLTQVALDLQPLVVMLRGHGHVHGWSHTLLGATVIGGGVALFGGPACRGLLRLARWALDRRGWTQVRTPPLQRWGLVSGALLGAWTHVALDGVMHADLYPWAPWSMAQPWLQPMGVPALHLACVIMGLLGAAWWWVGQSAHTTRRPD